MTGSDRPYEIQPPGDGVVVTFAEYVDHVRTPEHDSELDGLVESHQLVICDLSGSRKVTSDWLRFLLRLSVRAKRMGKRVAIVGMKENVKETSDMIGLGGGLDLYSSLEEARTM